MKRKFDNSSEAFDPPCKARTVAKSMTLESEEARDLLSRRFSSPHVTGNEAALSNDATEVSSRDRGDFGALGSEGMKKSNQFFSNELANSGSTGSPKGLARDLANLAKTEPVSRLDAKDLDDNVTAQPEVIGPVVEAEKRYITICERMTEDVRDLEQLDQVMLTGCTSRRAELAVETGLTHCARWMEHSVPSNACFAQCLFLKHWLILPNEARSAYPELMLKCFKSFVCLLQSNSSIDRSPILSLWSLMIQQNALGPDQQSYLYTLILGLVERNHRPVMPNIASLLDICVLVFTASKREEIRWTLVSELFDKWSKEATTSQVMAYLLVRYMAAYSQDSLAGLLKTPESVTAHSFESSALRGLRKAECFCQKVTKLMLNELFKSATCTRMQRLLGLLLENFVSLLWTVQLAPAEMFLTQISDELLRRAHNILRSSSCDHYLRVLAVFAKGCTSIQGCSTECAVTKILACPGQVYQLYYLASLQCRYKCASATDLLVATLSSHNMPTGAKLSLGEWRYVVGQSRLLRNYEAMGPLITSLAGAAGLSESSQEAVYSALGPIVAANPSKYSNFVLAHLERLTYSPSRVCQALVGLVGILIRSNVPESSLLLRRIQHRMVTPISRAMDLSVAKILSIREAVTDEFHTASLTVLLIILANSDADPPLRRHVSEIALRYLFTEGAAAAPCPAPKSMKALHAISKEDVTVKFGLRRLLAAVSMPQHRVLQSWMTWFCLHGHYELVCLFLQFGRMRIPQEYLDFMIGRLPDVGLESVYLRCLAAHFSLELDSSSTDSATSHHVFVRLSNMLTLQSGPYLDLEDVKNISVALHCCVFLCHPEIRKYREAFLTQIVRSVYGALAQIHQLRCQPGNAALGESGPINQSAEASFMEPPRIANPRVQVSLQPFTIDAPLRPYLSRLIVISLCVKRWSFVNDDIVKDLLSSLTLLYFDIERGDKLRCLIVQVVFGILNRRHVEWDKKGVQTMALLLSVIAADEELDSLIELLLNSDWTCSDFLIISPLLSADWLTLECKKRIFDRILLTHAALFDRARYLWLRNCLANNPALLDHCMPQLISLCFSHGAIVAQSGIDMFSWLCQVWQVAQPAKVLRGFEIASKLVKRRIEAFSRFWCLITVSCKSLDVSNFVHAVASAITQADGSESLSMFLREGLMTTRVESKHAQAICDRLAMAISRAQSSGEPLGPEALKRVKDMRRLEQWLTPTVSKDKEDSDAARESVSQDNDDVFNMLV